MIITKITKIGNSIYILVPKHINKELQLKPNDLVEISIERYKSI